MLAATIAQRPQRTIFFGWWASQVQSWHTRRDAKQPSKKAPAALKRFLDVRSVSGIAEGKGREKMCVAILRAFSVGPPILTINAKLKYFKRRPADTSIVKFDPAREMFGVTFLLREAYTCNLSRNITKPIGLNTTAQQIITTHFLRLLSYLSFFGLRHRLLGVWIAKESCNKSLPKLWRASTFVGTSVCGRPVSLQAFVTSWSVWSFTRQPRPLLDAQTRICRGLPMNGKDLEKYHICHRVPQVEFRVCEVQSDWGYVTLEVKDGFFPLYFCRKRAACPKARPGSRRGCGNVQRRTVDFDTSAGNPGGWY